jgi:hypothetical protein
VPTTANAAASAALPGTTNIGGDKASSIPFAITVAAEALARRRSGNQVRSEVGISVVRKKQFGGVKTHQAPFREKKRVSIWRVMVWVAGCVDGVVCGMWGVLLVWYVVCGVGVWLQRGGVLWFYK